MNIADTERIALTTAIEELTKLNLAGDMRVYVDDENNHPCYARFYRNSSLVEEPTESGDFDWDEHDDLNHAIAWLPIGAFLNDNSPWPGSYNPYTTLDHLRAIQEAL